MARHITKEQPMKHLLQSLAISALAVCVAGPALAAGSSKTSSTGTQSGTHTPRAVGQPNDSCGSPSAPFTPGDAASALGSAFNPAGIAGGVYAGQQPQNSNNPASFSQYDVACAH
jgi:hypothetical protein